MHCKEKKRQMFILTTSRHFSPIFFQNSALSDYSVSVVLMNRNWEAASIFSLKI